VAEARAAEGRAAGISTELAIYRMLVGGRVRSEWQYRTSFALFLLSQAMVATLEFASIAVIFTNIDALGGWSLVEVTVLVGINGVAFGLADMFASPVEFASIHIRQGTFDTFLIRPVSPLLQLIGTEFELRRVGLVVQPTIVLAIALQLVRVQWTPAAALLVATAIVSGAVIFGAIWVLTSSIAFWTVETQEIASSFTYGGRTLGNYPIDVFGAWLRRIVTFAVPIAFVGYLPAARLLGKPLPFGLPSILGWGGPAVALVLLIMTRAVWRFAIRHYRSTGS
jgi:ABC-2 type transport system permease protein